MRFYPSWLDFWYQFLVDPITENFIYLSTVLLFYAYAVQGFKSIRIHFKSIYQSIACLNISVVCGCIMCVCMCVYVPLFGTVFVTNVAVVFFDNYFSYNYDHTYNRRVISAKQSASALPDHPDQVSVMTSKLYICLSF